MYVYDSFLCEIKQNKPTKILPSQNRGCIPPRPPGSLALVNISKLHILTVYCTTVSRWPFMLNSTNLLILISSINFSSTCNTPLCLVCWFNKGLEWVSEESIRTQFDLYILACCVGSYSEIDLIQRLYFFLPKMQFTLTNLRGDLTSKYLILDCNAICFCYTWCLIQYNYSYVQTVPNHRW